MQRKLLLPLSFALAAVQAVDVTVDVPVVPVVPDHPLALLPGYFSARFAPPGPACVWDDHCKTHGGIASAGGCQNDLCTWTPTADCDAGCQIECARAQTVSDRGSPTWSSDLGLPPELSSCSDYAAHCQTGGNKVINGFTYTAAAMDDIRRRCPQTCNACAAYHGAGHGGRYCDTDCVKTCTAKTMDGTSIDDQGRTCLSYTVGKLTTPDPSHQGFNEGIVPLASYVMCGKEGPYTQTRMMEGDAVRGLVTECPMLGCSPTINEGHGTILTQGHGTSAMPAGQCQVGSYFKKHINNKCTYSSLPFVEKLRTECPAACGTCADVYGKAAHGGHHHSTARKDPHFKLGHGERMDFRGVDGGIFNLLSAKDFSLNAMTSTADFKYAARLVHGTKLSAAYWTVRTAEGIVHVNLTAAPAPRHGKAPAWHVATVSVHAPGAAPTAPVAVSEAAPFKLGGLGVVLKERTLVVKSDKWETTATSSAFPYAKLNPGKLLLDLAVKPLYDVEKDAVAPHGIFGQAYDGDDVAVDGARDKPAKGEVEMTTQAQAEGAIEGTYLDYKVASAFATDFKYGRFDKTSAPKRDATKLRGAKHKRSGSGQSGSSHADVEA